MLLLSGLIACVPRFERPQFSLVDVAATEMRFDEQHFRIRLHVDNPNARSLPVQAIHGTLELAGQPFGEGVVGDPFTVPPYGGADFDIDLRTHLALSLPMLLDRLRRHDAVDYRLAGEVETGLSFARRIPFEQSATLGP